MTQHPPIVRRRFATAAAALLLALPPALDSVRAEASTHGAISVHPRAAVSSDAYRTPPQLLSTPEARPLLAHRRAPDSARRPLRDSNVIPVDHQHSQSAAGATSVQAELQRLYAEEGREMPRRTAPAVRPAATAAQATPQQEERSSGLLAGLFDFGRSRSSRRSASSISRPPVEPAPFQPPTYRQQPRPLQTTQTPQQPLQQRGVERRTASSSAPRQQPSLQTMPSESVIELKRVSPQRDLAAQGNEFFPQDDMAQPQIVPEQAVASQGESSDDMAEFFLNDAAVDAPQGAKSAAVASAANTAKEKMQQMFRDQSGTATDGFQMPVETEGDIIPQPAPAAVSEVVTTLVVPPPAEGLAEPAPFFADAERAINPDESLEISALDGQTFDPSGADSRATAGLVSDDRSGGSRMQQIAARDGVGLKGYCPVALRDERRLADGKAAYVSYYQGRAYYFSSEAAKDRFDASPADYAPAAGGEDVTMRTLSGEIVEGSLDHSVWYKGRLYLFHTAENLKTFMAAPSAMAVSE